MFRSRLLSVAAIALFPIWPALAQSSQSAIVGTCVDDTGAVVAGAAVTARGIDTNARFESKTGVTGVYVLPSLPVGAYEVTIAATGFKTAVRPEVILRVGDRARVDFTLEVGVMQQRVEVQGGAQLVQTDNSGLGEVIENRRIVELPLISRNALALTLLTPGVRSVSGGTNLGFGRYQNYQLANISVNGSAGSFNAFVLDGGANTSPGYGEVAVAPLVESIQEFKVMTNFTPPEYGLTGGGVISTVTKSGTNAFHGAVYEFLRNDKLDARKTFAAKRPPFRFNQFGTAAGGPILIPQLYNGKDRTFFFFNYEGSRNRSTQNPITTVPTEAMTRGDFSALRDSAGRLIPIFDPATTVPNPAGAGFVRTPLPGNQVPAGRIDPVAKNVAAFIPTPNLTPKQCVHAGVELHQRATRDNRRQSVPSSCRSCLQQCQSSVRPLVDE